MGSTKTSECRYKKDQRASVVFPVRHRQADYASCLLYGGPVALLPFSFLANERCVHLHDIRPFCSGKLVAQTFAVDNQMSFFPTGFVSSCRVCLKAPNPSGWNRSAPCHNTKWIINHSPLKEGAAAETISIVVVVRQRGRVGIGVYTSVF